MKINPRTPRLREKHFIPDMNLRQTIGGMLIGLLLQAGIFAIVALVLRHRAQRERHARAMASVRLLPWFDTDAISLLVVFIGAQVLALLLGPLFARFDNSPTDEIPLVVMMTQVLFFPAIGLAAIAHLARRRGIRTGSWYGLGDWRKNLRVLGNGGLYYLAMMPAVSITALFFALFLQTVGYPLDRQPIINLLMDPSQPAWLRMQIVIIAVTLVPIIEESIFRGVFLPLALRRASPPVAVACVSFIFAALHMHIPSFAPLFVLACAFSTAYLQTGSLAVPIIMHALFNAISIAVLILIGDTPGMF